jgi:hypothetical protein
MKIDIYRYPHPHIPGIWIYTGQSINVPRRDKNHRAGREGFGRRFKKYFPGVSLPQPEVCSLDVKDYIEANEEETIAMFCNRTWHGQGGMNLTLPGSSDYLTISKLGAAMGGEESFSKRAGIHAFNKEQRAALSRKGGLIGGKNNIAKYTPARLSAHMSAASRSRSKESRIPHGRMLGTLMFKLRKGVHGRSREEMSEQGRKNILKFGNPATPESCSAAGKRAAALRVGIHGRSREEKVKNSKGAMHIRWHVANCIFNLAKCEFCAQEAVA